MDPQPSRAITALIQGAIDRAFAELEKNGFVPPMLVYRLAGGHKIERLQASDSAEVGRVARERARQLTGAEACVVVYEAYLGAGGQRAEAIIGEGHERESQHGFAFGKRYRPAQGPRPALALDASAVALGVTAPILPGSPPRLDSYVRTPAGVLISTLVNVVDRYTAEYFALHQGEVIVLRAELKAPQKLAVLTRVEPAEEWTRAYTDRLTGDMAEIRRFLDPDDTGLATCLVAVTRDHLGTPAHVQRLMPLLTSLQSVSKRVGGTGVRVLSRPSKGPGSFEDEAISLIRGLQP